ncbi:membrane hypothetical protein [Candidatus Magnetomoraceae bacterium gMMP-15]
MEPWFAPLQVIAALGVTVPLFIYYFWRIYSLILEHRQAFFHLKGKKWLDNILIENWNKDEISAQLALNNVSLYFDKKLGAIRRSLRADVYIIILIGFIGTLIGMIGSFTTLLMSVGSKGLDPGIAITSLVKGGLSTALVSSLIAAVMAAVVMSYLSFTEKKLVELKEGLNSDCLKRYHKSS